MAYYCDYMDSEPFAAEPPKWSMRRTVALVAVTNFSLWIGFIWVTTRLVAFI